MAQLIAIDRELRDLGVLRCEIRQVVRPCRFDSPMPRTGAAYTQYTDRFAEWPARQHGGPKAGHPSIRTRRLHFLLGALTVMAVALLPGCARLPSLDGRSLSMALQDTADTRLGSAALPRVRAHPGKSGVFALAAGRDAFAARVLLADASERSLDIQYYIWQNDTTGTLLFDALRRAADRGVRVRLLLDDNDTAGLDTLLAALDSHPNIGRRAVRDEGWRIGASTHRSPRADGQFKRRAAREDVLGGSLAGVHRLVQLRPPLRAAQYRKWAS